MGRLVQSKRRFERRLRKSTPDNSGVNSPVVLRALVEHGLLFFWGVRAEVPKSRGADTATSYFCPWPDTLASAATADVDWYWRSKPSSALQTLFLCWHDYMKQKLHQIWGEKAREK